MITEHFSWREAVAKSGYSGRKPPLVARINGRPVRVRRNVKRHARNLERVRTHVNRARRRHGLEPTGLNVLSWVRSVAKNRAVNGARDSRHLYGDATDFALEEIRRLCPWKGGTREFDRILDLVFAQGGVGAYPAGNRHADSRGYRARWSSWRPGR